MGLCWLPTVSVALLLVVTSAQAQNGTVPVDGRPWWVVQNVYRNTTTGCAAFDAVQATSWLNASCVLSSSAGGVPVYAVRSCNSTFVTSATCSDAQCTRCVTTATYPVNSCGTIIQAGVVQGVFFGCFQAASPPVMSNSTNNIFTDVTYTALDCTTNRLYQQISAVSGACVLGENRTCVCSGGTCTAARFATAPCNGTATAVTINQCLPRVDQTTRLAFSGRTTCAAAARLTTPPADGKPYTGPNPDDFANCDQATTQEQCVGRVPTSNGKLTFSPDGLLNKCCVWCGSASTTGAGQCRSPSFSSRACQCPSPAFTNFTTMVNSFGCNADTTTNVACQCGGKPLGAPVCSASTVSALIALLLIVASSLL